MKNFLLTILLLGSLLPVGAQAECLILNQLCPVNPYYDQVQHPLFQDMDFIANHDPNRCLQRARDWLNYCGNPGYSASYFVTGGVYKIAVVVYPNNVSTLYVPDFANRWVTVAPNY